MPYRTYAFVLGIVGLFVVAIFLFGRADIHHHAKSGNRWKRKLLCAGIMILSAVGLGPFGISTVMSEGKEGPAQKNIPVAKKDIDLSTFLGKITDPWEYLKTISERTNEIISGRKGNHPFDAKTKKALQEGLERAQKHVDTLAKDKKLTAGEADYWRADLKLMVKRVWVFRTTEQKQTSCYFAMPAVFPPRSSVANLEKRLPLLAKLKKSKKLNPKTLATILDKIERDIEITKETLKKEHYPNLYKKNQKLLSDMRKVVRRLRKK